MQQNKNSALRHLYALAFWCLSFQSGAIVRTSKALSVDRSGARHAVTPYVLFFFIVTVFHDSLNFCLAADPIPAPSTPAPLQLMPVKIKQIKSRSTKNFKSQDVIKPSAPPLLQFECDIEELGCKRAFIRDGKTMPVDSYHKRDGERLRPIIKDVPDAISELNIYQSNRRTVQSAAMVGTTGLLVLVGSILVGNTINRDPTQQTTGNLVKEIGTIAGASIALGSVVYSFGILRTNENHLFTSVENYNAARADDPIELKFSTGILF